MREACIPDKKLSAYLDQALSDAETRQVQKHLNVCVECRQRLATLQQADDMIRSIPGMAPSAGFDAAFWGKVAQLDERKAHPIWFQAVLGSWRPALASAAVAILVAGILVYNNIDRKPTMAERFMVENYEMLDDLELIQRLEILEHWDDIHAMKEQS